LDKNPEYIHLINSARIRNIVIAGYISERPEGL
jgi:hypothetical protein